MSELPTIFDVPEELRPAINAIRDKYRTQLGWQLAEEHVEPVKTSIDTMRDAAWQLVRKNGWGDSARLSLHQVTGLMAELGMQVYRGDVGCGYPDCGCCADAACEDAIKQHADFRPRAAATEADHAAALKSEGAE